jgi:predicted Zn-dependent protease
MRIRIRLTLALVFALAVACATSPTGRQQVMLVPEDQMVELGDASFAEISAELPKSGDRRAVAFVQCVARELTAEVGQPQSWDVRVFASEEANAFAVPGNHIGVYEGMLEVAETQGQLATVVAHEIGHLAARHAAERVSQTMLVQGGLLAVSEVMGDSEQRALALGALGVGAQLGVLMPFSRVQESEADRLGLRLMARAGFDPEQSLALWRNMQRATGDGPPEFLSTHPSHETRIRNLTEWQPEVQPAYREAVSRGDRPRCGSAT